MDAGIAFLIAWGIAAIGAIVFFAFCVWLFLAPFARNADGTPTWARKD